MELLGSWLLERLLSKLFTFWLPLASPLIKPAKACRCESDRSGLWFLLLTGIRALYNNCQPMVHSWESEIKYCGSWKSISDALTGDFHWDIVHCIADALMCLWNFAMGRVPYAVQGRGQLYMHTRTGVERNREDCVHERFMGTFGLL